MTLQITIVSDATSWVHPWLDRLQSSFETGGHRVRRVTSAAEMESGDLCFLLSCGFLISPERMALHQHNLVVHASALPQGRGWSPMTWQILEGRSRIPVTLFEAAESVDSGPIYLQETMEFVGDELIEDLRDTLGRVTVELCERFVAEFPQIIGTAQAQVGESSIYPRRRPKDSRLDIDKSLSEQFNLLRVVDNERYPAYFDLHGRRYVLRVYREDQDHSTGA